MHMFLTESSSLLYVVKPAGTSVLEYLIASSSQSIPLHQCNAQVYVKEVVMKLCTETVKFDVYVYVRK